MNLDQIIERCKLCGCGQPEEAARWLRGVLRAMKNQSDWSRSRRATGFFADWNDPEYRAQQDAHTSAFDEAVGLGPNGERNVGLYYFVLYMLGALGLEEHGTSAPGWLTLDGEDALEMLDKWVAEGEPGSEFEV